MNGRPESFRLLLVCLVLLLGCEAEGESTPVQAPQPSASATATPPVPDSVDISGCWREVYGQNSGTPLGSRFQLVKVEPNAFVFEINASRTKLRVKDYTFEEVNLDENKPFFPKGTVFSVGGISEDLNQISRTFTGEGTPRIYRRCEQVPDVYIPPSNNQPLPQATPSTLTPVPVITPLNPQQPPSSATPRPTVTPLALSTGTPGNTASTSGSSTTGSTSFPLNGPLVLPSPTPVPEPQATPSAASLPAP
ncbi:hypothetical protein COW36_19820 [bacterium (Candidatus Blackallbacteria) CG17_big_fil_post_rev_8_21_14_2_50_48_46]|uniref:Lipoprotein n=1 Tax=bacterium (Candidatus Blackallbacteria) CG17_big_fil_post_rev_8_21_14_2_50_48_46 TaxID=2014261 RepID=A0A2M7FZR4_9BACT|nr:MAG: hypothetical protein COW64_15475 [bacterium (Candidatus Blackallbacteria) CG18_big_fil_WC_8_21_14_2_50_49_26]PIW14898.1 MAG: hypothetical protein COW36_19820 [bacterium (Candidatus Blackallbacteria) CG17_big_fil_post_rev_8_21_14_2_50_48_46]PIW44314.1 MAG: hypothetical protein COW20_24540 [bacterium (Candidatus Blackallbacteria) CG13_big_fil_rev_8_21_14_2_50_49_14]